MSDNEKERPASLPSQQGPAKRTARTDDRAFAKGDREAPPALGRKGYDAMMAMIEHEWRRTRNPIWVWRAIDAGALGGGRGAPQFPLPAWCADYLRIVASRIQALSAGQDWRKPANEMRDAPSPPSPPLNQTRQIGPDAAMDLIPAALDLRKQGWNAFSIDAAAQARDSALVRMAELMASEPNKKAARRVFMAETGRTDEASVRDLQRHVQIWFRPRRIPSP